MKRFIKRFSIKTAVYLLLLVTLCLLPELTSAQYKWVLNGITTLRAGVSYFSSDVLKEESRNSTHYVKGWDGKTPLNRAFTIRNYENTLLYNPVGQELKFKVSYTCKTLRKNENGKLEEDTSGNTKCDDKLMQGKNSAAADQVFTIKSTVDEPAKDMDFTVVVTPKEGHPLKPGDRVEVVVTVTRLTNDENHEFAGTLKSVFQYEVSDGSSFVQEFKLSCESPNSRRFILKLGTGDVPNDSGIAQNIVIWWDTGTIGTTTVGNYVFNDILSGQRDVKDPSLKDYRKNYHTRTVDSVPHSYSMLRLRNIGSGGNREIAFEWVGELPEGGDLKTFLEELMSQESNRYVAPLTDPVSANVKPDNPSRRLLTDESIRGGAVIGYYIEEPQNSAP